MPVKYNVYDVDRAIDEVLWLPTTIQKMVKIIRFLREEVGNSKI